MTQKSFQEVLQNQVGLTLAQRAILYNKQRPDLNFTAFKIHKYLRTAKIKFKLLKQPSKMKPGREREFGF